MSAELPRVRRPAGFDAFWAEATAELDGTPPEPQRRAAEVAAVAGCRLEELAFRSLGGQRIGAYLASWEDDRPRPLIVHGHGYGGPVDEVAWQQVRAGAHVCGIDVRGYGRSAAGAQERSPWGYILSGVDSPETSVLRGAACDYLRGAEVALEALGPRVSRAVLHGASFAGGLATIAEALRPLADLLVLQVPSLAWTEARVELCRKGSGREIARFLSERPAQAATALHTLSFFDALHFAPAVTAPAIVGLGERDDVVPAMTVQALSERLAGPRELVRLPVSHSPSPLQRCWEEFEARWLGMAVEGLPVKFGRRSG